VVLVLWGLLEKGVLWVRYPVGGDGGEANGEYISPLTGSCVAFKMLKVQG
jgi:hypothetical protein